MLVLLLAGLSTAAKEPCAEAITEFAAYETLLRSDEYYPCLLYTSPSPRD